LSSGLRINRARDDAAGLSIANAFKNIGFSAAAIGTALTQAMVDGVPANPISVKREFTLDSSTDPTGLNTRLAMSMYRRNCMQFLSKSKNC
jgi:hypothetical protein